MRGLYCDRLHHPILYVSCFNSTDTVVLTQCWAAKSSKGTRTKCSQWGEGRGSAIWIYNTNVNKHQKYCVNPNIYKSLRAELRRPNCLQSNVKNKDKMSRNPV